MTRLVLDAALEVAKAILPITLAITVLQFTLLRMPTEVFIQFLLGALLVMLGRSCS